MQAGVWCEMAIISVSRFSIVSNEPCRPCVRALWRFDCSSKAARNKDHATAAVQIAISLRRESLRGSAGGRRTTQSCTPWTRTKQNRDIGRATARGAGGPTAVSVSHGSICDCGFCGFSAKSQRAMSVGGASAGVVDSRCVLIPSGLCSSRKGRRSDSKRSTGSVS